MLKIRKDNLLVFGLSKDNIDRLQMDQPIHFNLKDLKMDDIDVVIFFGDTEEDLMNSILDLRLKKK